MQFKLSIHTFNHIIKWVFGSIEWLFNNPHSIGELVVINYHGTQKIFITHFEKQLQFFQKKFTLIGPADLDSFYNNTITPSDNPFLLLTFDDGILNNLLATELLDKYRIKAYFFIVPAFVDTAKEHQKTFFTANIRPIINSAIDFKQEDFEAMNWSEINKLKQNGHGIGSHTKTHTLVNSDGDEKIYSEIVESKQIIEKEIRIESVNSFCSINESSSSMNKKAMDMVKNNYTYFFSTYPASNMMDKNKLLIYRCNVESYWLLGAVKYAIGKWDQKRWIAKINSFKKSIE